MKFIQSVALPTLFRFTGTGTRTCASLRYFLIVSILKKFDVKFELTTEMEEKGINHDSESNTHNWKIYKGIVKFIGIWFVI